MEIETPRVVTEYDEVPYPGKFYPQSAPGRLATLATLLGMTPTPVDHCRVLELGCGDGGNLIPLGYSLPGSQFVGVDLSSSAVANGRANLSQLGLTNVQLCAQNLLEFSDAGQFDYIVAHGIFSWVPAEVRRQMFTICSRHLTANGVAYISYNALPGGYLRRYPRELMRFHTRAITDPQIKVKEARNILDFVISAHPKATIEREVLKREVANNKYSDAYMYHDILAEENEPIYFLDFLDQAAAHGLQFLAEADPPSGRTTHLPPDVRQQLESLPDRRIREQYIDFIHCRRFRQTLLCRTGHELKPEFDGEALKRLLIISSLRPRDPIADINDEAEVEFHTAAGLPVKCREALPKAIYLTLGEAFPRALSYSELLDSACSRLGMSSNGLTNSNQAKIVRLLLSSFTNAVVELRPFQPRFATDVSERPVASLVARMLASTSNPVVSVPLTSTNLEPELRKLLVLLDGTRTLDLLIAEMQSTRASVTASLQRLANLGMLIG